MITLYIYCIQVRSLLWLSHIFESGTWMIICDLESYPRILFWGYFQPYILIFHHFGTWLFYFIRIAHNGTIPVLSLLMIRFFFTCKYNISYRICQFNYFYQVLYVHRRIFLKNENRIFDIYIMPGGDNNLVVWHSTFILSQVICF